MGNLIVNQNKLKTKKDENTIYNLNNYNINNNVNSNINNDKIDYCYKCDDIIIGYVIKHCEKCNKCHNKCKQVYCELCNLCIDPFDDIDIIQHRKLCTIFI